MLTFSTTIAGESLVAFLHRTSTPYLTRARSHFDPESITYSERLLRRWADRHSPVARQMTTQGAPPSRESAAEDEPDHNT
jgi:hypothetical protein